jgi:hypothetical protein
MQGDGNVLRNEISYKAYLGVKPGSVDMSALLVVQTSMCKDMRNCKDDGENIEDYNRMATPPPH